MGKNTKIHLVVIDPQNDFIGMQDGSPYSVNHTDGTVDLASLPVKGAYDDMTRLATMVDRIGRRLDDIHVTLDSHQDIDVGHPGMWMDQNGNEPAPFTLISAADIAAGIWTTRNPSLRNRMLAYAQALESSASHYKICVWPVHCVIGSWGHNVQPILHKSLRRWSVQQFATIDYVTKGSNPFTEHYGALQAEVPDPSDPSTSLNTGFLDVLVNADIVVVAGEASSHCVLKTVQQIADNIGDEHVKKFHLLTDCMSPVPAIPNVIDFPAIAQAWLKDMKGRGMTLTTSTEFLA
jgi:nicotinamidase/pyrazinamidase